MSIREAINRHRKPAVAVVVLAVAVSIWFGWPTQANPGYHPPRNAYFSDDDGKTYFRDDASKVPPWDHDGKEADLAHVFAATGGSPFVGYLERAVSPDARAAIADARAQIVVQVSKQATPMLDADLQEKIMQSTQVKRPGDTTWVGAMDPRAQPIIDVRGPGGADVTPVEP